MVLDSGLRVWILCKDFWIDRPFIEQAIKELYLLARQGEYCQQGIPAFRNELSPELGYLLVAGHCPDTEGGDKLPGQFPLLEIHILALSTRGRSAAMALRSEAPM